MKNALYLMLMVCFVVTVGCGGGDDKADDKKKGDDKKADDKKAMVSEAPVVSNVSFKAEGLS